MDMMTKQRGLPFLQSHNRILPVVDFKPDIIHCNDWQTGVVSILLNAHYKHLEFYQNIKTVYTIHNLKYQGFSQKKC